MMQNLSIVTVLLASTVLGALAIAMGCVLGWANRIFHVDVDATVEAILNALPGANCGACGFLGCAEYAEAVAKREAAVDLCIPGGARCAEKLAEIMGVEFSEVVPYRAVVHCSACEKQRLHRSEYRGESTCVAANLVAYVQGCTYGCLGLGDCVRACPHDAIHIRDGLARVDYDRCTGCGVCVRACPRGVLSTVPFKSDSMLVVACSNQDFGPDVKAVCKVGCLGCGLCARENSLIEMHGHLPDIDYAEYDPESRIGAIAEKCPRGCLIFVGKPTTTETTEATNAGLAEDRVQYDRSCVLSPAGTEHAGG